MKRIGFLIFLITCQLSAELSEDKSFAQFYLTKTGQMIMNPNTFTDEIRALLNAEHRFVIGLMINKYSHLLEVGCATSERAIDIVKFGRKFHGIDINPEFVEQSNKLFKQMGLENKSTATCFSALDLSPSTFPLSKERKPLILFPFNLMGNLDDFHLVLGNMIDIGEDFCFSTYKINELARAARHRYYSNCGCQNIRYSTTPVGDLFDSKDGLHSASFKIGYLVELLDHLLEQKNKKAKIQFEDLAHTAFMVYVHDISSIE